MATVETVGNSGFHLVREGEWEVTVRNDGMITLPSLVRPQDVPDLCGALVAAQPVGEGQQRANEEAQADAEQFFASQRAKAIELEEQGQTATGEEARRMERGSRREENSARAKVETRRSRAGGPRGTARTPRKDAATATPPPPRKRTGTQAARAVANAKAPEPVKKPRAAAKKAPAKKAAKRSG